VVQAENMVMGLVRKSPRYRPGTVLSWMADCNSSEDSDKELLSEQEDSDEGETATAVIAATCNNTALKDASPECLSDDDDSYAFPVVRHLAPGQGMFLPKINDMRYGCSAVTGAVYDLAVRGRQGEADFEAADRSARKLQFCQVKVGSESACYCKHEARVLLSCAFYKAVQRLRDTACTFANALLQLFVCALLHQVNFPLDDAGTVHYNAAVTWDLLSATALSPTVFAADCAAKFGLCESAAAALAASVSAQIEHHLDRLLKGQSGKVQPAQPLQSVTRAIADSPAAASLKAVVPRLSQQDVAQQQQQQQLVQQWKQQLQQQRAQHQQQQQPLPQLPPHPSLLDYRAKYVAAYQQSPSPQQQHAFSFRPAGQSCRDAEQEMQALLLKRRAADRVRPCSAVVAQGPCHLCLVIKDNVFSCCAQGCGSHALCETHLLTE
jgi:hypothetical protein